MQTIEVLKSFKFAERGCDVFEYTQGEIVEVSGDCAAVALEEKWAKKATRPAGNKNAGHAPENKSEE